MYQELADAIALFVGSAIILLPWLDYEETLEWLRREQVRRFWAALCGDDYHEE